MVWLPLNRSYC